MMAPGEILDFLKEALEDEQRIVTYKCLSLSKKVSVKLAKKYLEEFVRTCGDTKGLKITYCLSGYIKEAGQDILYTQIVKEEDKDGALTKYISTPSCQIYSLQKNNIQDLKLLYAIDFDFSRKLTLSDNVLFGSKCNHVSLRSFNTQHRKELNKETEAVSSNSGKPSTASSSFLKKSGGLSTFFAKQPNKKSNDSKSDGSSKDSDSGFVESNHSMENKNSISSLFVNHKKLKPVSESAEEKVENAKEPVSSVKNLVVEAKKSSKVKIKNVKQSNTKSKTESRRRIISDSSSEESLDDEGDHNLSQDMFEDLPSPVALENTPSDQETSKSTSLKRKAEDDVEFLRNDNQQNAKENTDINQGICRKRVKETLTYEGDDGFIVTEKVWKSVEVPISETTDLKLEAKKPADAISKASKQGAPAKKNLTANKKKPANTNVKQQSLTSFFQMK